MKKWVCSLKKQRFTCRLSRKLRLRKQRPQKQNWYCRSQTKRSIRNSNQEIKFSLEFSLTIVYVFKKQFQMENKEQKTTEQYIESVLSLLNGLDYEMIHEILREATHKARKKSILVNNSQNL